jgi:hypothetical protein
MKRIEGRSLRAGVSIKTAHANYTQAHSHRLQSLRHDNIEGAEGRQKDNLSGS